MPPVTVPVKKLPKINDLVKDPEPLQETAIPSVAEDAQKKEQVGRSLSEKTLSDQESVSLKEEPQPEYGSNSPTGESVREDMLSSAKADASDIEMRETAPAEDASALEGENILTSDAENSSPLLAEDEAVDEKFVEAWNTMFELLFREIPTVYYPLKNVTPQLKQHVVLVKVKNEMMKDNFESRVRLALEYLRNNYDPRLDDIQVEIEANPEQNTKLIYDTQDKMNDLYRENQDLPEFLKILNLSAKDM